jgi:hypothetical protein
VTKGYLPRLEQTKMARVASHLTGQFEGRVLRMTYELSSTLASVELGSDDFGMTFMILYQHAV